MRSAPRKIFTRNDARLEKLNADAVKFGPEGKDEVERRAFEYRRYRNLAAAARKDGLHDTAASYEANALRYAPTTAPTTKAQARTLANKVGDLLWAAVQAGRITFEQADDLGARCIELVFDHGYTAEAAVEAYVSATN